ncbi:MAG: N-6 DNA methylase, partial [Nitrospina sp.]|nr:N-6 DNA methylase [Nitrospina sp.]
KHPEDKPIRPALEVIFEGLAHADELGSLLQIEEPVERELKHLKETGDRVRSQGTTQGELFRPTLVQDKLPFGIQTYDEWRKKTVAALKKHFAVEAESADLGQAFFGQSVGKGLVLFDLLSRRYDVVTANPPYMGAGSMGSYLKKYTEIHFFPGKRDLYAAFMLLSIQLSSDNGRIAMVTRQSWMFLRYFKKMRVRLNESSNIDGLIANNTIEILSQLGPGAFREISGEVVTVAMIILSKSMPLTDHHIHASRLVGFRDADAKDAALLAMNGRENFVPTFRPLQARFLKLPEAPLLFWLTDGLWSLFVKSDQLNSHADAVEGVQTGNNLKWLRFHWEVALSKAQKEWVYYLKGGGYSKWAGFDYNVLRWRRDGSLLAHTPSATLRNSNKYFEKGLSYTDFANGCLGVRYTFGDEVFDLGAPGIYPSSSSKFSIDHLAGILNSRIASYLIRLLSPNPQHIRTGYIKLLPLPANAPNGRVSYFVSSALTLKKELTAFSDILSREFVPQKACFNNLEKELNTQKDILLTEGEIEKFVFDSYGLSSSDIDEILRETGKPESWFPIVKSYKGAIPTHNDQISETKTYLKLLFEAGPRPTLKKEGEQNEFSLPDKNSIPGAGLFIPAETYLAELSRKLRIHPTSVYQLIKEGIEKDGWRCLPEEGRITSDSFTVMVLHLLGYLWPKQIEANEAIPMWTDRDGIIPITDGTNERTLSNRIRERISAEFEGGDVASIEREFAEIIGKSIEQWLEIEFFKHHVKQFKKRPIAWQIQSEKYTRNNKPAFACLIYYHKLDEDLLPKIRTQYVGLLRQRCETELRGIEALPLDARSDRQEKRRIELETQIEELKHFDIKLKGLTESAFGPHRMIPCLRQNALEDSMLCLKAQWLKKLSGIIRQDPLKDWIALAEKAELHKKLPEWIMEPVYNLHYFCSKVGADTPKEKTFKDDPGAGELAEIICSRAEDMVKGSLRLVCTSWWKNLDDAVFTPLR